MKAIWPNADVVDLEFVAIVGLKARILVLNDACETSFSNSLVFEQLQKLRHNIIFSGILLNP